MRPIILATRGSALALTQANMVMEWCRSAFPDLAFEIRIYKTTGDRLQSVPPAQAGISGMPGTKGLFTKELEVALLAGEADLAVHSLKDLPTELPEGLQLGAVSKRADVRDILIYRERVADAPQAARGLAPGATLQDFPEGGVIATSSTRRQAQMLERRPDLQMVAVRGNVGTRLRKLSEQPGLDGMVLAAAGFERLGFRIGSDGRIAGNDVPAGLIGVFLAPEEMLPCVGQAALGIETRAADPRLEPICRALNDPPTHHCVRAERAFLRGMGGGCLSPVAALAEIHQDRLRMKAVSFREGAPRRGEVDGLPAEDEALGARLAGELS